MTLRLVFMGSPAFSVPALAELAGAGHEIAAVYSQPPKPGGRGHTLRKTPVHAFAETLGLEVRTPKSLKKPEAQATFAELGADLAVVVAYGLILPKPVLDAPRLGCINLHGSLLPRWRGAAPIHRAIMAGDQHTGVQVMQMEEGLDTGPVLLSETLPILPTDTTGSLHDRMAAAGAPLLVRAVAALERGVLEAKAQSETGVTYAAKIEAGEARIDWRRPANAVDQHIRGLSPSPGAWFLVPTEKGTVRVKALMSAQIDASGEPGSIIEDGLCVACGEGAVRLLTVQREGKQPMTAEEFLRGVAVPVGTRLE